MFTRLRRLWALSGYEVGTAEITTEDGAKYKIPALKNADAKPKGAAIVVEMTDPLADFTLEKDI